MSSFGKGAESLVEVLKLCEQTLAALDQRTETAESQPQPNTIRVQAHRRHGKFGHRFRLILGGLHQHRHAGGAG